jgi:hypothetical protein
MSEPLRFKPVNPAHEMIYSADGGWVSWEDYARLKAEVERLTAFTTRTIIPNEELQAQVERLTKAGDAFISVGVKMREMIGDHHWTLEFDRVRTDWYFAAKEGNPHA